MDRRQVAIGVMSGTSQDGVDAVLAEFADGRLQQVLGCASVNYPPALRERLLALAREATAVTAAEWAQLDRWVADVFVQAVQAVIQRVGCSAALISVIGSHGQTVFHDPDTVGSSLQLGDPSRLAVCCGIPVAADFRRADIAHGGQGAPLAPAFHHAVFAHPTERRGVLNLGGIANLTVLAPDAGEAVYGFDTGPANALLDDWIAERRGCAMDHDGAWAASGSCDGQLLTELLSNPYYQRCGPKSTGRGQFALASLRAALPRIDQLPAQDVQRTFLELTVETVARAVERAALNRLIVCGGGVRNRLLMRRLSERLPTIPLESSAMHGLDPQQVEGACFAWLALRRLCGATGSLPSVTGARRAAILGGLYLPS